MVHIPFDTRSVGYDDHIPHQQYGGGGGIGSEIIDSISSSSDDPLNNQHLQKKQQQQQQQQQYYFRGSAPYQRGYGRIQRGGGIGDVLRGLWRLLLPVVKRAGTTVGREVLSSGGRILDKLQQGENLKQATISEGKKSIDALLEKSGLPKQFGGGGGCSIKRTKKRVHFHPTTLSKPTKLTSQLETHQTLIGRPPPPSSSSSLPYTKTTKKAKRKRADTFGFY